MPVMHRNASILLLALALLPATPLSALTIVPEVSVILERLPEEKRPPLEGLAEQLQAYVGEFDWDPEEPRLELRFPIVIQFASAAESGGHSVYTANFATSSGGDVVIDEKERDWRFTMEPYARLEHGVDGFDPFLGMIDYHMRLLIAMEYDKLAEFGGNDQFELARRVADLAMFSEYSDGWSKRRDRLNSLLDPDLAPVRTLRWTTHLAFWFSEMAHNDYEAWNTILIAVDLAEQIDDPSRLTTYWRANHERIADLLVTAKDDRTLTRLTRIDNMDPQRSAYYQARIAELLR